MGGGEGVVDEDVAVCRELGREVGIVLLFTLVEAGVFQQQHVAVLQAGDRGGGLVADAVGGEIDALVEDFLDGGGDRLQRHVGDRLTLRAAEMGEQDDLGALFGKFADGRQHALDAGGVGDLAVLDGHVEVNAHQNALAGDVGEIVEGLEAHEILPVRAAIRRAGCGVGDASGSAGGMARENVDSGRAQGSTTRASRPPEEKARTLLPGPNVSSDQLGERDRGVGHAVREAHSLSYQDRTRTKLPSRTLVWSLAKIEEWLSWLKSRETSGSSV